MKVSSILAVTAGLGSAVLASPVAPREQQPLLQRPSKELVQPENDLYLIELSPGETRWIKEEQKWELLRVRYTIPPHTTTTNTTMT
jgi:hypothetical protein